MGSDEVAGWRNNSKILIEIRSSLFPVANLVSLKVSVPLG